ncbi:MAG: thioesterase [Alphaproteobacteria bacterium]|nr:thioesterase [Alphaproteobacteria bacterium]
MAKFTFAHDIKNYECDRNRNLRLVSLFNILQDAADRAAEKINLGWTFCVENSCAWVGTGYEVEILRLPRINEPVSVTTWPSTLGKLSSSRDFVMAGADGRVLVRASSLWVLIDIDRKRPRLLPGLLQEGMLAPDRAIPTDFPKLPALDPADRTHSLETKAWFNEIDVNQHVNNAMYPLWASESLGGEFLSAHAPASLTVEFKKETFLDQLAQVDTRLDGMESLSVIRLAEGGHDLAKVRVSWRAL